MRLWRAVMRYSEVRPSVLFGKGMPLKLDAMSASSLRERVTDSAATKPPKARVTPLM